MSRRHKEVTETKDRLEERRPGLYKTLRDRKNSNEKGTISIDRWETRLDELIAEYKTYGKNITMDDILLIKFK